MSLRITTESGAVYDYRVDDEDRTFIRRNGPRSALINYGRAPDSEWLEVLDHTDLNCGDRVLFVLADGLNRVTTPVVDLEEFED